MSNVVPVFLDLGIKFGKEDRGRLPLFPTKLEGGTMSRMILLLMLLLLPLAAESADRTLRVMRYTEDVAPWFFVAEDGSLAGAAVEMVELLAAEADLEATYCVLPWSRGLHYLQTGEVDLVLHLSRNEEREAYIHFLGVMGEEQSVLLLGPNHGGLRIEGLDDLALPGRKWGIEQDYFYSREFNTRLASDEAFRAHFYTNAGGGCGNLDRVRRGRLTGMVGDLVILRHALRESADGGNFTLLAPPFFSRTPMYIGISRKMPNDKAMRLQNAYHLLTGRRAFQAVLGKWGCLLPEEMISSR